MRQTIKILKITDLHLGVMRVETSSLITQLEAFFRDIDLTDIDMVMILGDIFDKALSLSNRDTIRIIDFLANLLSRVEATNTALRILDGTNSHDFGQSQIFVPMVKYMPDLDFAYINEISIESFRGFNFGYIPDNISSPLKKIKSLMGEKGIVKLDTLNIHAAFKFNLPEPAITKHTFDEEAYMNLVRGPIFNGHIHTPMSYSDTIHTIGSFSTYNHGEEMDKGGLLVTLVKDKGLTYTLEFVKNPKTTVFKTITVTDEQYNSLTSARRYITSIVKPLLQQDDYINIRIVLDRSHPLYKVRTIPNIKGLVNWTYKLVKSSKQIENTTPSTDVVIDKDSILKHYKDFLTQTCNATDIKKQVDVVKGIIQELKQKGK